MKNIILLFVTAVIVITSSCDNDIEVMSPTFDAKTEKLSYNVDDTVHFIFSGDAAYVTYYSGDKGQEYRHRFRTQVDGAKPILNFTSRGRFGPPERNLSLLIATDFDGTMNTERIQAADWQDISDRAFFTMTGPDHLPSGDVDLSDFIDFPQIHLAFKYVGIGHTSQAQKTWTIMDFVLNTYDEDNVAYPIVGDMSQAGWLQHSVEGDARKWRIQPNELWLGANANEDSNEDWVITKALNLASIAPDKGIALKTLTGTIEPLYHIYTEPGEYTVTFVAKNQSVYGEQEIIREIHLTIEEE
ncbi:DUF5017 domain-containing protein [Sphingobacterium sp. SGG-5]|uniref:DUF5017 domain-containing protein n=1 Tax=Sphingobacterium sp. SGG-5 TaxID=2710881 RepID=UPI0013EBD02B|nr:DUF5017 domain-containing protein [Sphingobacterium sp. SGG-5]NGM62649.1 DUF5017 domain-containing protein [Sphingobacterium sp. SGG-5]